MARPLRLEFPDAWYHVLNRGRRREKIFFETKDYPFFLELLGRATRLAQIEIHAFSLLPNHYHLLLHTPLGNLSKAMRQIDGLYAQRTNRKYSLDGALFRGRFKSILVDRESYLLELVRYIHLNPTRAGLEGDLGQHPWTSHAAYLDPKKAPAWLKTDLVLAQFHPDRAQARLLFHQFVKEGVPPDLERHLKEDRWPVFLGTQAFKEKMKGKLLGKKILTEDEVPQVREVHRILGAQELLAIVSRHSGQTEITLRKAARGENNLARRAFCYLAREYLSDSCRQIGEFLGAVHLSAISKQYRLAEAEVKDGKGCAGLVARVEKALKSQVKT